MQEEAGFLYLEAVKGRSKGHPKFTSLRQFFKVIFDESLSGTKVIGLVGSDYSILECDLAPAPHARFAIGGAKFDFSLAPELAILRFLPSIK